MKEDPPPQTPPQILKESGAIGCVWIVCISGSLLALAASVSAWILWGPVAIPFVAAFALALVLWIAVALRTTP